MLRFRLSDLLSTLCIVTEGSRVGWELYHQFEFALPRFLGLSRFLAGWYADF